MAAVQAKLGGAEKVTEIQDALAARIVEQITPTQASGKPQLDSRGRQKNIGADRANCSCVWIYSRSLTSQRLTTLTRTKRSPTGRCSAPCLMARLVPSIGFASDNATSIYRQRRTRLRSATTQRSAGHDQARSAWHGCGTAAHFRQRHHRSGHHREHRRWP